MQPVREVDSPVRRDVLLALDVSNVTTSIAPDGPTCSHPHDQVTLGEASGWALYTCRMCGASHSMAPITVVDPPVPALVEPIAGETWAERFGRGSEMASGRNDEPHNGLLAQQVITPAAIDPILERVNAKARLVSALGVTEPVAEVLVRDENGHDPVDDALPHPVAHPLFRPACKDQVVEGSPCPYAAGGEVTIGDTRGSGTIMGAWREKALAIVAEALNEAHGIGTAEYDVDAWMGTAEEVLAAIEAAWTAP